MTTTREMLDTIYDDEIFITDYYGESYLLDMQI